VKLLLIVNTSASSVTARAQVVIKRALAADHALTVAETGRRGHAARLAQGAARAGVDAVVVFGGDGTLNEAANGVAGTPTALGVLPGGSTNVLARTIGMTNDPVAATGEFLDALAAGSLRTIGLGSVNGRYFLFHAGMGFDAAVVEQVERRAALKRYASHPLFVYSAFATWFRHYDRRRPRLAVHYADALVDDAYFVLALNSNPYTFLGKRPLDVAPDADLDRPLTVVSLRSLGFVPTLRLAAAALGFGPPVARHRQVDYRPDITTATVVGHGPFPYQVDGDFLGEIDRVELRWEPDMLRLVVPFPRVRASD
jgi:diacylglycerol kinase family enzyme